MDLDGLNAYRRALEEALSDGVLDQDETQYLRELEKRFGLSAMQIAELASQIRADLDRRGRWREYKVYKRMEAPRLAIHFRRVREGPVEVGESAARATDRRGAVDAGLEEVEVEEVEVDAASPLPAEPAPAPPAVPVPGPPSAPKAPKVKTPKGKSPRHPPEDLPASTSTDLRDGELLQWMRRANGFLLSGDPRSALEYFDRILEREDEVAEVWFGRGVAMEGLGRALDALASYDAALQRDPAHILALDRQGMLLGRMGRLAEATEAFRRECEVAPSRADGWFNMGLALELQNRHEEAIEPLRAALRLNPSHIKAWFNLANAYANLGDFLQAVEGYAKVLELDPKHEDARINRNWCIARMRSTSHGKPEKDYYEVLMVPPTASVEEIRSAYRMRIREYHPDRAHASGEERAEAERMTMLVNEALAVLSDRERRAEYDQKRVLWFPRG